MQQWFIAKNPLFEQCLVPVRPKERTSETGDVGDGKGAPSTRTLPRTLKTSGPMEDDVPLPGSMRVFQGVGLSGLLQAPNNRRKGFLQATRESQNPVPTTKQMDIFPSSRHVLLYVKDLNSSHLEQPEWFLLGTPTFQHFHLPWTSAAPPPPSILLSPSRSGACTAPCCSRPFRRSAAARRRRRGRGGGEVLVR